MSRSILLQMILALVFGFGSSSLARGQAPKGPRLPEGVQTKLNVAYGDHARNQLDLFVPKGEAPFPLVIWIHGGGWELGSKENSPALFLLEHGFAVAAINYRYSQQAPFPAQIQDCKAAVSFLRANAKKYNLNPDAFGAWGSSAGGHLSALLGTSGDVAALEPNGKAPKTSSSIRAVLDFYGPTDIAALAGPPGGPGDSEKGLLGKLMGGPVSKKKELAASANPVTHVGKGDAPMLIVHGDKDPLVPVSQSELLVAALKKADIEVEFQIIQGAGHGGPQFTTADQQKKYVAFFNKHLKAKQ